MANIDKEILGELSKELAALKERLSLLEKRIEELTAVPAESDEPIDMSIEAIGGEWLAESEAAAPAPVEPAPVETAPDTAEPEAPVEFAEPDDLPETSVEPEPEAPAEPQPAESEPTQPAPQPTPEPAEEPALKRQPSSPASLPWKRDTVGIRVKNIRSAISLMDRVMFINMLFGENVALYDKTIADLNNLDSFEDAIVYVEDHFPDWDLTSDQVYMFMMSVRKKLG